MPDESFLPIIIDSGWDTIKAGFAGCDAPKKVFPCLIGYEDGCEQKEGIEQGDAYVGEEAKTKRQALTMNNPIEYGIITNWDDMEKIWHHTFYRELHVAPEAHPILLTVPPQSPKANHERMAKIMFETFNVPAIFVASQPLLALYASGRSTGIVLESGAHATYAIAVFESFVVPHSIVRVDHLSGNNVTEYLSTILTGFSNRNPADREVANGIKENLCYVSLDFEEEMAWASKKKKTLEKSFALPDGEVVIVGNERFFGPEALFLHLERSKIIGIPESIVQTIMSCDPQIRSAMYTNIMVSGGNTMFPGFVERLSKELTDLAPASWEEQVRVVALPDRQFSVWRGGSLLANLSTFQHQWITRWEYDEDGPSAVHTEGWS